MIKVVASSPVTDERLKCSEACVEGVGKHSQHVRPEGRFPGRGSQEVLVVLREVDVQLEEREEEGVRELRQYNA